jgi:hypothetical protein
LVNNTTGKKAQDDFCVLPGLALLTSSVIKTRIVLDSSRLEE